jgi:WD40 repeat protein
MFILFVNCSSDNSIRVWDMNTNKVKSINSQAHNSSCLSLLLLLFATSHRRKTNNLFRNKIKLIKRQRRTNELVFE